MTKAKRNNPPQKAPVSRYTVDPEALKNYKLINIPLSLLKTLLLIGLVLAFCAFCVNQWIIAARP